MSCCTRLQAILVREQRALLGDHVAAATVLVILGSVIAALVR